MVDRIVPPTLTGRDIREPLQPLPIAPSGAPIAIQDDAMATLESLRLLPRPPRLAIETLEIFNRVVGALDTIAERGLEALTLDEISLLRGSSMHTYVTDDESKLAAAINRFYHEIHKGLVTSYPDLMPVLEKFLDRHNAEIHAEIGRQVDSLGERQTFISQSAIIMCAAMDERCNGTSFGEHDTGKKIRPLVDQIARSGLEALNLDEMRVFEAFCKIAASGGLDILKSQNNAGNADKVIGLVTDFQNAFGGDILEAKRSKEVAERGAAAREPGT